MRKSFVQASLTRVPIFLDTESMGLLERISYVISADHTVMDQSNAKAYLVVN